MIKTLLRLSREAIRYRTLYAVAIFSTLALTAVNLTAPKLLSAMTGIVEEGVTENDLGAIGLLTLALVGLYLLRILFRFLSNYLAHKAAWFLVGDLRTKTYDKLEHMHHRARHPCGAGGFGRQLRQDERHTKFSRGRHSLTGKILILCSST
ncbi:MAG: hypothetical protein K5663_03730 [Clostridiales bacterium]|nr:hypothetical protein [Clostridiales bacterium]